MIEKEKESMKRRAIAAAGAAAVGAAAAVVALVAGTTVGFAETSTSSAYGVAAEGVLEIEPIPYVESSDGSTKTDSLVELPENPLLNVAVAKVSAGDGQASVKLADVSVLPANVQLPKNLKDLQKAVDQLRGLLAKPCDASKPKLPEKLPKNPLTDLVVELTKKLDPKPLCDVIKGRLSVLELGLVGLLRRRPGRPEDRRREAARPQDRAAGGAGERRPAGEPVAAADHQQAGG